MIGALTARDSRDRLANLVVAGALLAAAATGLLAAYSVKYATAVVFGLAAVLAAFFRPVIVVTILFLTVYPSTITFGGISIQRLGGPLALLVAVADPNFFAALQVIAAPLAVGLFANTASRMGRCILAVALTLIAGSIPASLSRGGMVALIVTGIVIAIIPSVYLFASRTQKRKFF